MFHDLTGKTNNPCYIEMIRYYILGCNKGGKTQFNSDQTSFHDSISVVLSFFLVLLLYFGLQEVENRKW